MRDRLREKRKDKNLPKWMQVLSINPLLQQDVDKAFNMATLYDYKYKHENVILKIYVWITQKNKHVGTRVNLHKRKKL